LIDLIFVADSVRTIYTVDRSVTMSFCTGFS